MRSSLSPSLFLSPLHTVSLRELAALAFSTDHYPRRNRSSSSVDHGGNPRRGSMTLDAADWSAVIPAENAQRLVAASK